jgi:hypothetical protein
MGTISYVEETRSDVAPSSSVSARTAPVATSRRAPAASAAPAFAVAPAPSPTASTSATPTASAPPPPAVTTTAAAPAPTSSVSAEIALLQDAQTALASGNASRALALLDDHARRFPTGALGEERDAERIFALCALGRAGDAHAWAGHFLAAYPRSLYAARIKSSCAAPVATP